MSKRINPQAYWTDFVDVPRDGEGVDGSDVELPVTDLLAGLKYVLQLNGANTERIAALEAARGGFVLSGKNAQVIEPSRSYPIDVYVGKTDGFNESVNLSVLGLPAGLTAAWSENPTVAGVTTLTLTSDSNVQAGTYNLTVAGASATRSAQYELRVTVAAATLPGTFQSRISYVSSGGNDLAYNVYIGIERQGGFTDPIAFSTPSIPAGMVATWTGNPSTYVPGEPGATAEQAILRLDYTNVAPGSYDIQIRATSGSIVRTMSYPLTIDAPAPTPQQDFSAVVIYDAGDPLTTRNATLSLSRSGGYTGPIYVEIPAVMSKRGKIQIFLDGGAPLTRMDGNSGRLTLVTPPVYGTGYSTFGDQGGIADLPAGYPDQIRAQGVARAVIGGVEVRRTFTIKIRYQGGPA